MSITKPSTKEEVFLSLHRYMTGTLGMAITTLSNEEGPVNNREHLGLDPDYSDRTAEAILPFLFATSLDTIRYARFVNKDTKPNDYIGLTEGVDVFLTPATDAYDVIYDWSVDTDELMEDMEEWANSWA